jgi:hypothetical protein
MGEVKDKRAHHSVSNEMSRAKKEVELGDLLSFLQSGRLMRGDDDLGEEVV